MQHFLFIITQRKFKMQLKIYKTLYTTMYSILYSENYFLKKFKRVFFGRDDWERGGKGESNGPTSKSS